MNINAMMQQAKKLQAEMDKKQAELNKKKFKITKQGIEIIMMGNKKLASVKINEALIDPDDPETLEDMIIIAVNEGLDQIDQVMEDNKPKSPGGASF